MSVNELREKAGPYGYVPGQGFNTIALHNGHKVDSDNRARAPPIFQSTSFEFKSAEHGGALFELSQLGPIYTRLMNPTTHVLEYKMAELEGAPCKAHGDYDNAATLPNALALSSGQSAQMHALLTFMQHKDTPDQTENNNFIASKELYGGTYTQFKYSFEQIGITVKFVDISNLDEIKAAIDVNTKAIYFETIANPSATVPDFAGIAAIGKENSLPLIVDNTFGMGGYTCKPIAFGANVIVESATKWIGGHGTSVGGIIVDGSNFDWRAKKADGSLKFPLIAAPQKSYHDGLFVEHPIFGVDATNTVFILLARVKTLRDMGGCIAPFNSFQLLQGLETLALRAKAHCENANNLAAWLDGHENVKDKSVCHPSLPSHPSNEMAKKYFRPGCFGSVFVFEIKGAHPPQPLPPLHPSLHRSLHQSLIVLAPCASRPQATRPRWRRSARKSSSRRSRCARTSPTWATHARLSSSRRPRPTSSSLPRSSWRQTSNPRASASPSASRSWTTSRPTSRRPSRRPCKLSRRRRARDAARRARPSVGSSVWTMACSMCAWDG